MPFRERYLFVCTNRRPDGHPTGSCAQKGSEDVVSRLKAALAAGGARSLVRACASSCLDLCESGVIVLQEPEHVAYGTVTVDDVVAIAEAAASGQLAVRLVVHPRGPRESNNAG